MKSVYKTRFARLLVSSIALLTCINTYAADAPSNNSTTTALPPTEHFFQDPVFSRPILSPDGKLLAFLVGTKGAYARLGVLDLQTFKPRVVASFKDGGVRHFQWVNDQRLVFSLTIELTGPGMTDRGSGLFAVNADGSEFKQLVETQRSFVREQAIGIEQAPWNTFLYSSLGQQTNNEVLVYTPEEISKEKIDHIKLKLLNTKNGRIKEFDTPLHSNAWLLDGKNEVRIAETRERNIEAVHYKDDAGQWKKLVEFESLSTNGFSPEYFGPDGNLYVTSSAGRNTRALFTYDLINNKLNDPPVFSSEGYDIYPSFIATEKKLLGVRYKLDGEVTQWLDADMRALQVEVDELLTKTANRLNVPKRGNTPHVLVEAYSDKQPTITYLYNIENKKLIRLGSSHSQIDPRQMGAMDIVHYKASDGLDIPAYLTLPPGGVKKNLPMVVLVHGGPWLRGGTWHWNPEVQFLASRGYAVLQPEFRGSTGFGDKHFTAGLKQWGLAMQSDVADGARWAIAQGIADPKRIAIAGESYGGYAALMGLIKNPELFRCGINWLGVTDISLMYTVGWSDASNEYKRYGMPKLIGDSVKDAEQFKATSPLVNASKIKQPLLMAYGGYDVRVPIIHGEKFRDAVKQHNSQVEWVKYSEEGHGWSKVETRIDFWTRVEKFLAKQLVAQ